VGSRTVDIYRSQNFSGTPFKGVIIRPYVCLPEDAINKFSSEELDAVVARSCSLMKKTSCDFDILAKKIKTKKIDKVKIK
jgi:hypothetical protein